jgi:response regulator of citrate/malate metabolism
MIPHVLVVDKDSNHLSFTKDCISKFGYTPDTASSVQEMASKMKTKRFHVILMLREIHEFNGVKHLKNVISKYPDNIFILMSENRDAEKVASTLVKYKVFDFLFKPFDSQRLKKSIDGAYMRYCTRKKRNNFVKSERLFYQNFINALDWKKELCSRKFESIAKNLIKQMNIEFFHGGSIGGLISVAGLLISRSNYNQEKKVFEIPENLFSLIRGSYAASNELASSFSKAQNIIEEDKTFQKYVPLSEFFDIISGYKDELDSLLKLKNQNIFIGQLADSSCSGYISYDKEKMKMVFKELLINSMKYSHSGSSIYVLLFIKEKHLEVKILNPACENNDGTVGITGKNETMVFEPFYRLSSVVDDNYIEEEIGYGLGLTVTKKIIDLHNANIFIYTVKNHLHSKKELDVCVTIRFPLFHNRMKISNVIYKNEYKDKITYKQIS